MRSSETPQDKYIRINGLNIHYLDWGGNSSSVLLLVHGLGGNAHNWDHVVAKLGKDFRVLAIDQRGHGDSDHTWEGYAVQAFASDLAQFAEALGIVPYDYCGASLGGRNAIAYAGDYPHHLKHLVCVDIGPEISTEAGRHQIQGANQRPLGWRSIEEYVEFQRPLLTRASEEHLRHQGEHSLRRNYAGKYVLKSDPDLFWINGGFGAREVPYLWEQWAKIRCPILVTKGEESYYLSPEIVARMRELQPKMRLVEVPNSGHGITAENPSFLLKEMASFLAS